MRITFLLLFGFAALLNAQTIFRPMFPQELAQYLQLTPQQVESINRLNGDALQFSADRQRRIFQVQMEIGEWTGKSPLDPMALGLRYAELESIRREIAGRQTQTRTQVQALLTETQKARLKLLDDARKQQPLIGAAECENLLDPQIQAVLTPVPANRAGDFSSGVFGFPVGGAIGGVISTMPFPVCGGIIRNPLPLTFSGVSQPFSADTSPTFSTSDLTGTGQSGR